MENNSNCGVIIHQIHNTIEKNGNNQLKKKGLTFSQMAVLLEVRKASEKQVTFKELEKLLMLAQSTTVGLISRLEQKKLVNVFGDKNDKRIKYVELTTLGEEYCIDAEKEMEYTENQLLSALSESEKEIFLILLKKVNENLKK